MNKACYRKPKRYKYQLVDPYSLNIGLSGYTVDLKFLKLSTSGRLTIEADYAWDGPSGPTCDTPDFMRGSLVHDALYQLLRLDKLPSPYKAFADLLLKKICLEDGMCKYRAAYVYLTVRLFGGAAARPGSEKPDKKYCVPVTG